MTFTGLGGRSAALPGQVLSGDRTRRLQSGPLPSVLARGRRTLARAALERERQMGTDTTRAMMLFVTGHSIFVWYPMARQQSLHNDDWLVLWRCKRTGQS